MSFFVTVVVKSVLTEVFEISSFLICKLRIHSPPSLQIGGYRTLTDKEPKGASDRFVLLSLLENVVMRI